MNDTIYLIDLLPMIALGGALMILVGGISSGLLLLSRRKFLRSLQELLDDPQSAQERFRNNYSIQTILRRSDQIESFAEKNDPAIISLCGIDEIWIESLKQHKQKKEFERVLKYAPDRGLFWCFLAALEHRDLARRLLEWLENDGDFLPIRRLAFACNGEHFDGKKGFVMLKHYLDRVRELAGDPEWTVRSFALHILMYDTIDPKRSKGIIHEALNDSRSTVRCYALESIKSNNHVDIYEDLFHAYLSDPVFEVRKIAARRLRSEYRSRFQFDVDELKDEEILHVLELLQPGVIEDEKLALRFLDHDNLEARLLAARFLEQNGTLLRLVQTVHLADREEMERNLRLLTKALSVNVSSFLSAIEQTTNPATLLLCGKLLLSTEGFHRHGTELVRRIFSIYQHTVELHELYEIALTCIEKCGEMESYSLLNGELLKWGNDTDMLRLLLPSLPASAGEATVETLFQFLQDDEFSLIRELEAAFLRIAPPLVLPRLMQIIKSDPSSVARTIRRRALHILGAMKLPYCMQTIIEQLSLIEPSEAQEFVALLAEYPGNALQTWVEKYLKTDDSQLRAALIMALPAMTEKKYHREIKNALRDSDPDVRIAAIHALVELKDPSILNEGSPVLRDPVERVRLETARVLGASASEKIIKKFDPLIADEDEALSVKIAAVRGLAFSPHRISIEILIRYLESASREPELAREVIEALALKTDKKSLKVLVELFKDVTPRLKGDLTDIFRIMGDDSAPAMRELLEEGIASLKPYVVEVLEESGSVERHIRMLQHRDPSVRRDSARFLSAVGSLSAFRGLVMAAQDPDEEVRILVIRALESLETEDGKILLKELLKDPDRRVRRYTHWAQERLKTKSL